jgi:hypothetical protein
MILFEVISSRERGGSEREQIRRRGLYHIDTRDLETKDKDSDRLHDLIERSVCLTSQHDEQRTQRTIDHGRLRRLARVYPSSSAPEHNLKGFRAPIIGDPLVDCSLGEDCSTAYHSDG